MATRYQSTSPYADTIQKWAQQYGVDPNLMMRIGKIESGLDPRNRTGTYKGLFQLSDSEFNKYGGGNIWNADDNARAAAAKIAAESRSFRTKYDRDPSPTEIYMLHQQGEGGLDAHLRNPDAPAWQNMFSTAEGRQKGPSWSRQAIWGNVPGQDKAAFEGGVGNLTSRQFLDMWGQKVEGQSGSWGGPGVPGFAKTLGGPDPTQAMGTLSPGSSDSRFSPVASASGFVPPTQAPGSTSEVISEAQPKSQADLLTALADAQTDKPKTQGILDAIGGITTPALGGDEWAGVFKPIEALNLIKNSPADIAHITPGLARARAAALRGSLFKEQA